MVLPRDAFSDIPQLTKDSLSRCALSGRFATPIHEPHIRSDMMGPHQTMKVREYLAFGSDDRQFLKDSETYEALLGNGTFDPPNPYQLRSYYVESVAFSKLRVLLRYIDGEVQKANIAIVGPKGSGKTALQNCWLSKFDHELQQRKAIWIRCDVSV